MAGKREERRHLGVVGEDHHVARTVHQLGAVIEGGVDVVGQGQQQGRVHVAGSVPRKHHRHRLHQLPHAPF